MDRNERRYLAWPCLILALGPAACAHARPEVSGLVGNWFASQRVDVGGDHGTGVIIHEDGYVLTAKHVVAGAGQIDLVYEDEQGRLTRYPAAVVASDDRRDLAVIKTGAGFGSAVALADMAGLQPGDAVYDVGYPYACGRLIARGHIMNLRVNIDIPAERIRVPNAAIVDMLIGPGDSGGGLFLEKDGRLAGIVIGIIEMRAGQESPMPLRIVVSVDDIKSFLDREGIPYHD